MVQATPSSLTKYRSCFWMRKAATLHRGSTKSVRITTWRSREGWSARKKCWRTWWVSWPPSSTKVNCTEWSWSHYLIKIINWLTISDDWGDRGKGQKYQMFWQNQVDQCADWTTFACLQFWVGIGVEKPGDLMPQISWWIRLVLYLQCRFVPMKK